MSIVKEPYKSWATVSDYTSTYRRTTSAANYERKGNKYLSIPAFSVTGIADIANAENTKTTGTYVVKKFFFTLSNNISFPEILVKPSGVNFLPVLWWIDDNDVVQRRKLWVDNDVSLYATLYTGEKLPGTFAIEIWPQDGETTISFAGLDLATSTLIFPTRGSCPADLSGADNYTYTLGTDPIMDVDTYTWSGVDGDYWLVDSLGFTTFVDLPTVTLDPGLFGFFDSMLYSEDTEPTSGGQGWDGNWVLFDTVQYTVVAEESFDYTLGTSLSGNTGDLGLGPWV